MISLNDTNLESVLLAETRVAVMFSCRTLARSAKVSCRTLQVAEPKVQNLKKDHLAELWNVGSFRTCPIMSPILKSGRRNGPKEEYFGPHIPHSFGGIWADIHGQNYPENLVKPFLGNRLNFRGFH